MFYRLPFANKGSDSQPEEVKKGRQCNSFLGKVICKKRPHDNSPGITDYSKTNLR